MSFLAYFGKIWLNSYGEVMKEKIEYILLKLFLYLAQVVPKVFLYVMIKYLTLLVYTLDKKRRLLTIQHLHNAFREKTTTEIEILAKTVYIELSKTISEILLMFVNRFDIDNAIVNKEESIEKLRKLTQNSNGIIVMTAHFSNWELAAHFLAKHGLPMLAIGRKGNNKLIDTHITIPFREKYGNHAVSKKKAIITMLKKLKSKGNIGLLIDQKSGVSNSAKLDFFGIPAETTLSVASLKLKLNVMVVPIFIARQDNGLYKMIINEPIGT
jgi:KDO2-lipid IV(A) lauroyltransferase